MPNTHNGSESMPKLHRQCTVDDTVPMTLKLAKLRANHGDAAADRAMKDIIDGILTAAEVTAAQLNYYLGDTQAEQSAKTHPRILAIQRENEATKSPDPDKGEYHRVRATIPQDAARQRQPAPTRSHRAVDPVGVDVHEKPQAFLNASAALAKQGRNMFRMAYAVDQGAPAFFNADTNASII
jgi:hypothetical protein